MQKRTSKGAPAPLTPSFFDAEPAPTKKPAETSELEWLRGLLAHERRRHGQVERILTRTVELLERQIADLRQLYMGAALRMEVGPKL